MAYNITWMESSNTLVDIFQGVNTASNGLVGGMILLLTFMISFAAFKNYDTVADLVISSFITTIIGGLLWFIGFISFEFAVIPLILFVVSLIIDAFK